VAVRGVVGGAAAALADLNRAYRNFFDSVTGKRKGPKAAPPRFRSRKDSRKDSRQSVRFTANARFQVLDSGKLRLPKAGDVAVRWSRPLPSAPSSVTVIRDAAGWFFASFVVEVSAEPLPETGRECGIDLGLGHFAVLDDGTKVSAPRFLRRAEKKLKRAQGDLSRKHKRSANREKARVKVARARQGRRRAPRLPPQALHQDHPRKPSGDGGRPRGESEEHRRPGTQGGAKRLWRPGKTTARGGTGR